MVHFRPSHFFSFYPLQLSLPGFHTHLIYQHPTPIPASFIPSSTNYHHPTSPQASPTVQEQNCTSPSTPRRIYQGETSRIESKTILPHSNTPETTDKIQAIQEELSPNPQSLDTTTTHLNAMTNTQWSCISSEYEEEKWMYGAVLDADVALYLSGERKDEDAFLDIYGLSVQNAKILVSNRDISGAYCPRAIACSGSVNVDMTEIRLMAGV
ncbi:hypothetical protein BO71DRAFT_405107 [Aspergillus ellipticus CBS 707.79]|uniref:Uncharacterized protein n=1 Tax=Aspergillus ellipticus CBS 707.79 TaxID=1448320 RepID=A0A319DQA9_9EURO|nr:hypothetical protein BO71DRAFT_405107 [Aspergillus ellipticus CBS 707.79]